MLRTNAKILIVDDAELIRNVVADLLKEKGFTNLCEADTGKKAFEMLQQGQQKNAPIELMLCDINMPEMNGIELIKLLKQHEEFDELPIIMITSEGEKKIIIEMIKLGVGDYLVKPNSSKLLFEKIERLANRV